MTVLDWLLRAYVIEVDRALFWIKYFPVNFISDEIKRLFLKNIDRLNYYNPGFHMIVSDNLSVFPH